ncbi:peptide ABC transporter substrate-binding protein [Acetobacter nitrogenifigens]|uniref:Peptide ABC transporter substrate-binding protein n=1 Tax=Acetobacter nitrogenifigens DSM 23921 = NBRC 105050 TaxID=1120919 RepID=A0A511XBK4_9PROT|nr:peptide ABC transporter substrate-binding protein [Acetobacter nitrogenifigens]GEN60347.1 peptide ABC transporter substrate-binding protein [Acetobacter nitrogenifigens DSM 23921 = NBRC 105050]
MKLHLPRRRFLEAAGCVAVAAPRWRAFADAPSQIIVGLAQEPTVFHPLLPHIEVDDGVHMNLFSPLWSIDAKGAFVPDLAENVPDQNNGGVSADGLTWRVKLRGNAFWHDGRPVTAADVVFTFETLLDPSFPAYSRKGFEFIEHVEQTGPLELTWRMRKPYAPFHAILASAMIVPAHLLKGVSDTTAFTSKPVGSGPFMWDERIPSDHIRLRANQHWHLGRAGVDYAIIRYIPDVTVMFTQFETGEIDYLGMPGIPPNRYRQALTLPGRQVFRAPQPFVESIAINMARPQFHDIVVRQAIYTAIDKQGILETLFENIESDTESFLPSQSSYYNPDLPKQKFDPQAAAESLDRAGWRRRLGGVRARDGVKLEFVNATTSGNALRQQVQEVIQQNLADIGIIMRIENRPAAVMWGGYWSQSRFDTALVSVDFMTGSDPDASSYFTSDASPARGGAGQNVFQLADSRIDSLFLKANASFDHETRLSYYRSIQSLVRTDLPFLPLYQQSNVEGVRSGLTGFESNVNVRSNLWNLARWRWTAPPQ